MKTITTSTRLFSLFALLLVFSTSLLGQKRAMPDQWIGLHNFYYQNKTKSDQFTGVNFPGQIFTRTDHDAARSLGLYYRVIKENNSYHHFDVLTFDLTTDEYNTEVLRISDSVSYYVQGRRSESTNIRLGYRRGKMFPLLHRLTADVSLGGYPIYQRKLRTPFAGGGFPRRETWLGLGLSIHTGLNYQIHKKINIGYSFLLVAAQWSWYEERVENPILFDSQKRTRSARMDTQAFESMLDFRNININYVIDGEGKFRKKKRR